jgi:hypothetical protein
VRPRTLFKVALTSLLVHVLFAEFAPLLPAQVQEQRRKELEEEEKEKNQLEVKFLFHWRLLAGLLLLLRSWRLAAFGLQCHSSPPVRCSRLCLVSNLDAASLPAESHCTMLK